MRKAVRGRSRNVFFMLLFFACVVLHEFGHALAAKAFGINTPDITLLPIGGVARLERMPEEPKQELIIAAGRTGVNVDHRAWPPGRDRLAQRGGRAQVHSKGGESGHAVAQINVLLVLFNLLPAFPMDGGRVSCAPCWRHD